MADLHVEHTLKGIKLGPKLGPFPVVVWVIIVAAGLYVAHRRTQANSSTDTSSSTDTTTDTSSSTDTTTDTSSDVPYGVSNSTPTQYDGAAGTGGSSAGGAAVQVSDNLTWAKAAIDALVKDGFTATLATNAIDKYLAGSQLTQAEAHAVNVAVAQVGAPPEGAPPVHVKPPATPTPAAPRPDRTHAPRKPRSSTPAPKPSNHAPRPTRGNPTTPHGTHYTVKAGDTLTAIASRHHVSEPNLYRANKHTIETAAQHHGRTSSDNGHWIFPGTVLVIP